MHQDFTIQLVDSHARTQVCAGRSISRNECNFALKSESNLQGRVLGLPLVLVSNHCVSSAVPVLLATWILIYR